MESSFWLQSHLWIEHHVECNGNYTYQKSCSSSAVNEQTCLTATITVGQKENLSKLITTTTITPTSTPRPAKSRNTTQNDGDRRIPLFTRKEKQPIEDGDPSLYHVGHPKQKIVLFSSNRNGAIGKIIYQRKIVTDAPQSLRNKNKNDKIDRRGAQVSTSNLVISYSKSNTRQRSRNQYSDPIDEHIQINIERNMRKPEEQYFKQPPIEDDLEQVTCRNVEDHDIYHKQAMSPSTTRIRNEITSEREKTKNNNPTIIGMFVYSLEIHPDYRGHDLGHFLWTIATETICRQHEEKRLREWQKTQIQECYHQTKQKLRKVSKPLHEHYDVEHEHTLRNQNYDKTCNIDDDNGLSYGDSGACSDDEIYYDADDSYHLVCHFDVKEDMIRYNRLISYYQRLGYTDIFNDKHTLVKERNSISYRFIHDPTTTYRSIPMEFIQKRYYENLHVFNQHSDALSSMSLGSQHENHALTNVRKRNNNCTTNVNENLTTDSVTRTSGTKAWYQDCSFIPIEFVNSNGIDIKFFSSQFHCDYNHRDFYMETNKHYHATTSEKMFSTNTCDRTMKSKKEKVLHLPFGRWLLVTRTENSDLPPSLMSSQRNIMKEPGQMLYHSNQNDAYFGEQCGSLDKQINNLCDCLSSCLVELQTTKGYGLYVESSSSSDTRCLLLPRDSSLHRMKRVTLDDTTEHNSRFLFRFIPLFHRFKDDRINRHQHYNEEVITTDPSNSYRCGCVCSCNESHQRLISHHQHDYITYGVLQSVVDDCYLSLDGTKNILLHCCRYPSSSLWTLFLKDYQLNRNQSSTQRFPGANDRQSENVSAATTKTLTLQHLGTMDHLSLGSCSCWCCCDILKRRVSKTSSQFTSREYQFQQPSQKDYQSHGVLKPVLKLSIIDALLHHCHQISAFPRDDFDTVLNTKCPPMASSRQRSAPWKYVSLCSYCFYVAEYYRWNGHPDWVQIIGLVYHLDQMFMNDHHEDCHDSVCSFAVNDGIDIYEDEKQHHKKQAEGNITSEYILRMLQSNQARLPDDAWKLLQASSLFVKKNEADRLRLVQDHDGLESFQTDFINTLQLIEDQVKSKSTPLLMKNQLTEQLPSLQECQSLWEMYYLDIATKYHMTGIMDW